MKEIPIGYHLKVLLLCAAIILIFLAVTFEPAYGYQVATLRPFDSFGSQSGEVHSSYPGLRNDSGAYYPIFDNYYDNPHERPVAQPPIPEPTTLLLVGLGLAVAGIGRRIKR